MNSAKENNRQIVDIIMQWWTESWEYRKYRWWDLKIETY